MLKHLRWRLPDGRVNWLVIPAFVGIVLAALILRELAYLAFHV